MRRRFVQINGELIEVSQDYRPEPRADYHVMGDIDPYRSMATGEVVGGRRQHREHLKANGLVEVGNETKALRPWGNVPATDWKPAIIETMRKKGLL